MSAANAFAPFAAPRAITFSMSALHAYPMLAMNAVTLLDLRRRGIRMGVISDADLHASAHELAASGIADFFEQFAFAEATKTRKPDPAAFHPAIRALQVDARDVWHVGVDPERDAEGAMAAGAYPIVVGTSEGPWVTVPEVGYLTELIGD